MSLIQSKTTAEAAAAGGKTFGFLSPFVTMGSSWLGGMAKRRAARESANAEIDNAIAALVEGKLRERSQRGGQSALLSLIRNRAAGAGVDVTQGAPLDAYLQAARETELDILSARHSAEAEAAIRFKRAKLLRVQGEDELWGSLLKGGSDVLDYLREKDKVDY